MSLHCLLKFCVQVLQFILFIFFFIFLFFSLHFETTKKHFHCLFVQWLLSLARVLHAHTHTYTMCLCVCTVVCVCALAGFQCSNNCDCVNLNVSQVIFLHTTDARMAGRGRGCMGGRWVGRGMGWPEAGSSNVGDWIWTRIGGTSGDLYRTHTSAQFWYVPFVHCAALTRVRVCVCTLQCVCECAWQEAGGRDRRASAKSG